MLWHLMFNLFCHLNTDCIAVTEIIIFIEEKMSKKKDINVSDESEYLIGAKMAVLWPLILEIFYFIW